MSNETRGWVQKEHLRGETVGRQRETAEKAREMHSNQGAKTRRKSAAPGGGNAKRDVKTALEPESWDHR